MNIPMFLIPLMTGAIIQIIKLIIDGFNGHKISIDKIFAAGGFPSVHSGLSTSLLITIGYLNSIYSSLFAITLIFSILFWYDASNVRYQAGKHAEVINNMRKELSELFSIENERGKNKLKERLGHTFFEVISGIIISIFITILIIILLNYLGIDFSMII